MTDSADGSVASKLASSEQDKLLEALVASLTWAGFRSDEAASGSFSHSNVAPDSSAVIGKAAGGAQVSPLPSLDVSDSGSSVRSKSDRLAA